MGPETSPGPRKTSTAPPAAGFGSATSIGRCRCGDRTKASSGPHFFSCAHSERAFFAMYFKQYEKNQRKRRAVAHVSPPTRTCMPLQRTHRRDSTRALFFNTNSAVLCVQRCGKLRQACFPCSSRAGAHRRTSRRGGAAPAACKLDSQENGWHLQRPSKRRHSR